MTQVTLSATLGESFLTSSVHIRSICLVVNICFSINYKLSSIYLCVFTFVHLFVICLSMDLFICLFIYLSVYIYLLIYLFGSLFICLSTYLPIYLLIFDLYLLYIFIYLPSLIFRKKNMFLSSKTLDKSLQNSLFHCHQISGLRKKNVKCCHLKIYWINSEGILGSLYSRRNTCPQKEQSIVVNNISKILRWETQRFDTLELSLFHMLLHFPQGHTI